jgi:hypothetical protein
VAFRIQIIRRRRQQFVCLKAQLIYVLIVLERAYYFRIPEKINRGQKKQDILKL